MFPARRGPRSAGRRQIGRRGRRLHRPHLATVGRGRPPLRDRDRRVGTADQRAAARVPTLLRLPAPLADPARPAAARNLRRVRRRRPQPATPRAERPRLTRRDRPRAPRHRRAPRHWTLHPTQPPAKHRLPHLPPHTQPTPPTPLIPTPP